MTDQELIDELRALIYGIDVGKLLPIDQAAPEARSRWWKVAHRVRELFQTDDAERMRAALETIQKTGERKPPEYFRKASDEAAWYLVQAQCMRDLASGALGGASVAASVELAPAPAETDARCEARWELEMAMPGSDLGEKLSAGWEPYAVACSGASTVHFLKRSIRRGPAE
jgi:hypothetical protein